MGQIVDRRTLDFLLYEVLGLDELLAEPPFAAWDRMSISGVLDVVEAVAAKEFLPLAVELDANEPRFVDGRVAMPAAAKPALEACARSGLFGAALPHAWGGLELPAAITLLVNGVLACANIGLANYQLLTTAAANLLHAFGSETQKAAYLPPMVEGRWFGTMCLSEPQAGSSLGDIRTRAEPAGDGRYRILGSKMWISGGDHELAENIVHMVLAKLPEAPAGVKGISLFIVPKRRVGQDGVAGDLNNIALAGLNHKMGQRGTTNCLLNFGETGDCIGELVGEPHKGLSYMFHMMNEARLGVGTCAVMLGLAGYAASAAYAAERRQGRPIGAKDPAGPQVPIVEHADIKRLLLAQKAAVEGALALNLYCATLVDRMRCAQNEAEREELSLRLDLLTPIAKSWPSEHCLEANKHAMQVLGGYGYTRDYPVERLYRDNRLNPIHEGTAGIQGLDLLGRKVGQGGGRALAELLAEISATAAAAKRVPDLGQEAGILLRAVAAFERATDAVAGCPEPGRALANATLYLDAAGHVVVAWLWLRQALAASRNGDAPHEAAFLGGKLAACRYFCRYELPHAIVRFELVESLDQTCQKTSAEEFVSA